MIDIREEEGYQSQRPHPHGEGGEQLEGQSASEDTMHEPENKPDMWADHWADDMEECGDTHTGLVEFLKSRLLYNSRFKNGRLDQSVLLYAKSQAVIFCRDHSIWFPKQGKASVIAKSIAKAIADVRDEMDALEFSNVELENMTNHASSMTAGTLRVSSGLSGLVRRVERGFEPIVSLGTSSYIPWSTWLLLAALLIAFAVFGPDYTTGDVVSMVADCGKVTFRIAKDTLGLAGLAVQAASLLKAAGLAFSSLKAGWALGAVAAIYRLWVLLARWL